MAEESVKVAVRVRPFNSRERQRNAKCIIQMSGDTTTITDPGAEDMEAGKRTFTFDHSYWSHDGMVEDDNGFLVPQPGSNYVGQTEVFKDIGVGILDNAWKGYNTSLFAYGQTGSGKSWSVVGYGENKGIVPRFCEEIFSGIEKEKSSGTKAEYEVVFSMLEIYNEAVYDLLDPKDTVLKVRQHPKKGFYADGLITVPVKDYADIERRIEQGTKNRTIASTNMNASSSRAHTIVGVTFIQKAVNAAGQETAKSSIVNLVDLAGSERVDSTGATGDRLKEGAAINQSLSNLGNCISALAEKSEGKKVRVPFRDSTLTKLLKNALGGNSKTIMIAALSPADINYDETLSTLRYADRAKQIKTKAVVNEDPTEKLIKDLQEENEKLKEMIAAGKMEMVRPTSGGYESDDDNKGLSEEEIKAKLQEEFAATMAENERMLKEMEQSWKEKLDAAAKENKEKDELQRLMNIERKVTPHIYNLSPDAMLTGMIVFLLKNDINTIGRSDEEPPPDIPLMGINIMKDHGEIRNLDCFKIKPNGEDARILVNGVIVEDEVELHHNDRILIGTGHLYLFHHPSEMEMKKENGESVTPPTYEDAQQEIAQISGVGGNQDDINTEVAEFLPHLNEANGISEELDKKVQFEPVVLNKEVKELIGSKDDIICKITQLETGYVWYWQKQKLINRKFAMEEMYRKFQRKEEWNLPPEKDPFYEPWFTECLIGATKIYLQPLAHLVSIASKMPIIDCRGLQVGELDVAVVPCDADGQDLNQEGEDSFIEDTNSLLGKPFHFKININQGTFPKRYTEIFCKYNVLTYDNVVTDCIKESKDVTFMHTKHITINKMDQNTLDSITNGAFVIKVRGRQRENLSKPINNAAKIGQTTRQIRKIEAMLGGKTSRRPRYDSDAFQTMAEYLLMRKRRETLEKKLLKIRQLCDEEEAKGETKVSIADIRELLGFTQFTQMWKRKPQQTDIGGDSPPASPPASVKDVAGSSRSIRSVAPPEPQEPQDDLTVEPERKPSLVSVASKKMSVKSADEQRAVATPVPRLTPSPKPSSAPHPKSTSPNDEPAKRKGSKSSNSSVCSLI